MRPRSTDAKLSDCVRTRRLQRFPGKRNGRPLRRRLRRRLGGGGGFAAATVSPGSAQTAPVQNETVAHGPPFRSPSRFRFRPPDPLTFGFRLLPPVPASTYLRSVLG